MGREPLRRISRSHHFGDGGEYRQAVYIHYEYLSYPPGCDPDRHVPGAWGKLPDQNRCSLNFAAARRVGTRFICLASRSTMNGYRKRSDVAQTITWSKSCQTINRHGRELTRGNAEPLAGLPGCRKIVLRSRISGVSTRQRRMLPSSSRIAGPLPALCLWQRLSRFCPSLFARCR